MAVGKIKLDLKDKKLLTLLDENSRYSNSQIAKKVGLSKPAVEYRIKRFEKNNVIFNFYAVVDFTKLGYSQYKLYIKFQNTNLEDEQKIIDYWIRTKNVMWVAEIRGRWDLTVSMLAKSNFEFGKILYGFMNKFSKFVLEKDVLLTEYSPIYSREYLTETKPKEFVYGIPEKIYELDEADIKILQELSTNARINFVDLAEKTKLTRDIINYRIKKLTEKGIVIQYRCYLNLQNLGINHYKVIFRTKNLDETAENKIKQYTKKHKKATQFLKLIGSWDLEIEFETENEDELYRILTEIRKEFSDIIRDFDILRITKNYKFSFFPF
ncbi:MAG: winged helix-turn-helix transcriptional regulator [Candidatus Nanoarchaeia archaeon]|nr:winged helix-turn-helix transcriptional regulator [Candidatus Nanoarchaeia archaeon]MDD5740392.1 winged helix-turn-helix transcriptional regulator [Candidatus Nanoarchaeia archaeon]